MPPEQLDYCERCNAPIYMENVAGACTCQEGKLRALAANLKQQVGRREALAHLHPPAPPVPAKPPARPIPPRPTGVATAMTATIASRPRYQELSQILMADARRDLGLSEESEHMERQIRASLGVPEPIERQRIHDDLPPSQMPAVRLEDLWRTPFTPDDEPGLGPPPDTEFNIEFDEMPFDEENGPRPTGDREATRFRVDRGAPQREPFRGNIEAGPQGGPMREAGRSGRFPVMREVALPNRLGTRYAVSEPEFVGRLPVRQEIPIAPKPSPRQEPPIHRPTVYDRLRNSDFLDDD